MTLAAYNAGVGRVDAAVKRSKLNDYWALSGVVAGIPARRYPR